MLIAENSAVHHISALRRPNRSATQPNAGAPISSPINSADNSNPLCARPRPQSGARTGSAYATASMSKPLKNVAIPTTKRVRTCHLEKGIRSMRAVMDVVEAASTPLLGSVLLVLHCSLTPIGGLLRQQTPP